MNKKTRITISTILLIITCMILLDYVLQGTKSSPQKLHWIYEETKGLSNTQGKRLKENVVIVELQNGKKYQIARIPDGYYDEGEGICFVRTPIFRQIKYLQFENRGWIDENVSILSYTGVRIFVSILFIISVCNVIFDHIYLKLLLSFAMLGFLVGLIVFLTQFSAYL